MATSEFRQYAFPRVKRVSLRAFSLYSLLPNVSVSLHEGVLCLAGANGIGKSTFLATVNYGLTGAVPHPGRRLLSNQAYYKEAANYATEFFSGRIAEADREDAAVTIEFDINGNHFTVTRGLFDENDVREFKIHGTPDDEIGITSLQRADRYREHIARAIGLTSFEQFVFLQHFVFTFDESRHLLFWDQAATAQVLFLCFGGDPRDAANADTLNRDAERAGSRGRNAQFQVNKTRQRIETLQQSLISAVNAPSDIEDLDLKYQSLQEEAAQALERAERSNVLLSEAELKVTQHSASVASLRAAYSEVFNRFLHGVSEAHTHPLIVRALGEGVCGICDATGSAISTAVQLKIDAKTCPLCGTSISSGAADIGTRDELAAIDARLAGARSELDEATSAQERLRREATQAKALAVEARDILNRFENEHREAAEFLKAQNLARSGPVAQTLLALQQAMAEFVAQRDADYAERDHLRSELRKLQRDIELRYARAEELFLPRFRKLAELFLGIDLDISLQMIAPVGMKLVVELRGNARHDENQLSESQRFFVDIALRMALAQQMSMPTARAMLLIDTPEGSLDIAYEDRAGEMFARFAESGHDMIMTANINSSKLLTTLAKRSGTKHMSLNQMIGWTELSDVQRSASVLFETAYKEIVEALQFGPAS